MAVTTPEQFLGLVADPQRWQLLTALAESDRRRRSFDELRPISDHREDLHGAATLVAASGR